ncbi:MAG: precorrin-8X methylmutase [Cyanobacteria bacterium P01_H01_bin.130]
MQLSAAELALSHPILVDSFAIIDREFEQHYGSYKDLGLTPAQYAVVRRVIHTTADFSFARSLKFSPDAIAQGITAIAQGAPIITDVTMVAQGIKTLAAKTFSSIPIIPAIAHAPTADPGRTRTETGLLRCLEAHPNAIVAIGNAPTALSALCDPVLWDSDVKPALVIGAPVGFVGVVAAKEKLANTAIAQIRVDGRKGGSTVAAAIVNALLMLAWESTQAGS